MNRECAGTVPNIKSQAVVKMSVFIKLVKLEKFSKSAGSVRLAHNIRYPTLIGSHVEQRLAVQAKNYNQMELVDVL